MALVEFQPEPVIETVTENLEPTNDTHVAPTAAEGVPTSPLVGESIIDDETATLAPSVASPDCPLVIQAAPMALAAREVNPVDVDCCNSGPWDRLGQSISN
jgi:hypothetical protein